MANIRDAQEVHDEVSQGYLERSLTGDPDPQAARRKEPSGRAVTNLVPEPDLESDSSTDPAPPALASIRNVRSVPALSLRNSLSAVQTQALILKQQRLVQAMKLKLNLLKPLRESLKAVLAQLLTLTRLW
jgi:hypothetical protein